MSEAENLVASVRYLVRYFVPFLLEHLNTHYN